MKYVVTWRERPTGSVAEYEAAQQRVLEIFSGWEMPESLTFHQFLVRLGEFGGDAARQTDAPRELEYLTTRYAGLLFTVGPVMGVVDAVAARTRRVDYRDRVRE